jgi:phage gp29-like protein
MSEQTLDEKKAKVPMKVVTVLNTIYEPPSIINQMDVDRVSSIIIAAQNGMTRDYFALVRDIIGSDSHLQTELGKRKLAVMGDVLNVRPYDSKSAADVETARAVAQMIDDCSDWMFINRDLMDSVLWPVSVVEKVYRIENGRYVPDRFIRVPPQLLDYTTGTMMIHDVDLSGAILPTKHEPDPRRYIIHRGHLLSSPDNWGGPIRSLMFWWLLSAMSREWWARFLDRYGSGFLVGKYDPNDEGAQGVLERAFMLSTKLGGLVITKETEVEIKQAAASDSGDAFSKFHDICNREKSKLVLGQTLSTESTATGLGSGNAVIQESVRQDIRRFDQIMLAHTHRHQFIQQFCEINRLPGRLPKIGWGSESTEEIKTLITLLENLKRAGLKVSDDSISALSEKTGLSLERDTAPDSISDIRGHVGGFGYFRVRTA